MPKILVTGASGLLGSEFVKTTNVCPGTKCYVYPTHRSHPAFTNSLHMDITDEAEVRRVFAHVKPDLVLHTAAETNVDACETRKRHALAVNAEATQTVAKACHQTNSRMVYISTDYVFDGEKGEYVEEDDPKPINHYGLTKLLGEKHVINTCKNCTILRTSVLYGWHPQKPNFATWVIRNLEQERSIAVVDDHYNSPTLASNLAETILAIAERNVEGIYHTAGSERISRYRFAHRIAETFDLNTQLIKPVRMRDLKAWTARRPRDSSLCTYKIKTKANTELFGVAQGLMEMKREWARVKSKE